MKYTANNLAHWAGFCGGCLFLAAIVATFLCYAPSPNPKLHWWGLFWGIALGQFINSGFIIPAIRRRVAKRKDAADPSDILASLIDQQG